MEGDDGFVRDPDSRGNERQGHVRGDDRFNPRVAVGVFVVGRVLGPKQGRQYRRGRKAVAQRMNGVGQQSQRVPEPAAQEFDQRQAQRHGQPAHGGSAGLPVQVLGRVFPACACLGLHGWLRPIRCRAGCARRCRRLTQRRPTTARRENGRGPAPSQPSTTSGPIPSGPIPSGFNFAWAQFNVAGGVGSPRRSIWPARGLGPACRGRGWSPCRPWPSPRRW